MAQSEGIIAEDFTSGDLKNCPCEGLLPGCRHSSNMAGAMPTKTVGWLLLNCTGVPQRDGEKLRAINKQLMAKCESLSGSLQRGSSLLQWENRQ